LISLLALLSAQEPDRLKNPGPLVEIVSGDRREMNPRKRKAPPAAARLRPAAIAGGASTPKEKSRPGWRLPAGGSLAEFGLRSGLIAMELLGGRVPFPSRPEEAGRARRRLD
jgi:hypothetical protein